MSYKLTDNEIKKALELCQLEDTTVCETCPLGKCYPYCDDVLAPATLDLLNRKDAKIEWLRTCNDENLGSINKLNDLINRLQAENKEWKTLVEVGELQYRKQKAEVEDLEKKLKKQIQSKRLVRKQAKAEAYKECIEKIKTLFPSDNEPYQYWEIHEGADNLLKELVGDNNDTCA